MVRIKFIFALEVALFPQLCLAGFSHGYIIAETISSPNGHMNIKWQDLQEKTKQHHKV